MSLLRSGIISRAGGQRNPGYETRLGGIGLLSGIAVPEMSPLFAEIVWFNKNYLLYFYFNYHDRL